MKKTLALTLGLMVLAAGLAIYIFVVEKKPAPAAPPGEWQPTLVLEQGNTVDQVTLVRPSDKIVFHVVPGTNLWKITAPVQALAHPIYVDMMIRDIVQMQREKLIDLDPVDLAKYQLDKPQGEIIAHYTNGRPDTRVLIGKLNYNQDHLFAKLAGQPTVFLIKPDVAQYLEAPLDEFRSKALFLSLANNVLSVEIKIEDPALKQMFPYSIEPKLVVQKQPGARPQWVIVSPIHENAEFGKVKEFFNKLTRVQAAKVFDASGEGLARYGLDQPSARIVFTLLDGDKEEIDFGAHDAETGAVYARNTLLTQVVPISGQLFSYLMNNNFRGDKILADIKVVNVSSLSLEFPGTPEKNLTINKEKAMVFYFAGDPESKATGQQLSFIFAPFMANDVFFINQVEPLPVQKYGLEPGNLKIKVYDGENLALDVVLGDTVTQNGTTGTYVKDNLRKCIVFSPANLYDKMPLSKESLKATPEDLEKIEKRRLRRNK
ncbi:MAG TPA: DUF4340 domain-containing protein [bacterium]|nr:DUF4340 domain-containing protein [bacterium]